MNRARPIQLLFINARKQAPGSRLLTHICCMIKRAAVTKEVSLAQRIPLTTMEFRVLHFLLKNRGVVVSHQDMERALWGGRMDSSRLAQKYVQRVRSKLGDNPREPYWIRSVRGVGYQFIGPST